MLPSIYIEDSIASLCPNLQIGLIHATVSNSPTSPALWEEIDAACNTIKQQYQLLDINKRPAIAATRKLYHALGKDPNRYRVASEALCRRAVKGLGLYQINTLVDLINLVSLKSGYPISGLDADKIKGNSLKMGVGKTGEAFSGIGRGLLNIEGIPVYRDEMGGIATPTSDEERTKIDLSTTTVQININAFAPEMAMTETMDWCIDLLQKYSSANNIETDIYSIQK